VKKKVKKMLVLQQCKTKRLGLQTLIIANEIMAFFTVFVTVALNLAWVLKLLMWPMLAREPSMCITHCPVCPRGQLAAMQWKLMLLNSG
jgi:formate dehydrogenase maturation protein FdhE